MVAYALLTGSLAALGLLLILEALAAERHWLGSLFLFGIGLFSAGWFGATALTLAFDAARAGPAVVMDAHGLQDRRQGVALQWPDVTRAEIRPKGNVSLTTRCCKPRSGISFRIGARRRRGDQFVVPLQFLSPPPHISALVMTQLIEDAGGAVVGKPFWTHS